jgi:UDP-2,3-diacylglucosamine pyrophosphatase LpxH
MNKTLSLPASYFPQFDALYVISDLHLGGAAGFQIFDAGAKLTGLVDHLQTTEPAKRVALVINGDMVDFLAEKPALPFDPADAVAKLNRIVDDRSFAPVWRALQKFTAAKNRYLVVNLGNHDLELALPWVRAHLLEILSGGNDAARGRITLSFEGTGYRCRVGNAQVLCVHGNEVDDWNLTDHETIRRMGRDAVQERPVNDWVPNAGTQLVITIMNDLKKHYPFIDLLKPEKEAVVPAILALQPDQRDKVRAIAATAGRLFIDKFRRRTGFLGNELPLADAAGVVPANALSPGGRREGLARRPPAFGDRAYADALLRETEERLKKNVSPLALVADDQRGEYLGLGSALRKFFRGAEAGEVLREALDQLGKDRSFIHSAEDETYTLLDEQVGSDVDVIAAGHTHLARSLRRKKGRGWYFNSGTWVRLIELKEDVLKNAGAFRQVFDAFKAGDMAALDNCPGLVKRQLTVVALWSDGGRTHGALRHVAPEGTAFAWKDSPEKPDYSTPLA